MPTLSVIQINKPGLRNKGFLPALMAALISMLLSAATLVIGFLGWHCPQFDTQAGTDPITITGDGLFVAIGKGDRQDNKLVVTELAEDGTAVISSWRTRLNASNHPVLEYKIKGRNPGTDVVLYWRTVTHNHQTIFANLHWNSDYKAAYNMRSHPEWKGQITELGISIAGNLRNEPITIEELTFRSLTVKSLLLTVWSEWNAFQGWTPSSINVIKGMPAVALISPVVAAAAWGGLAMLMYSLWAVRTSISQRDMMLSADRDHPDNSIWNTIKRIWDIRAVVSMFLIAWLTLDGKWQVNLWRQLADTKYLFANKSHHEQHLAAEDAKMYSIAKHLRESFLPKEPIRLFILDSRWQDRTRLKLAYYLYPHNVFPYYNNPQPHLMKEGDFVLVLNPLPWVKYSSKNNMLGAGRWKITAQELEKTHAASLYKVTKEGN